MNFRARLIRFMVKKGDKFFNIVPLKYKHFSKKQSTTRPSIYFHEIIRSSTPISPYEYLTGSPVCHSHFIGTCLQSVLSSVLRMSHQNLPDPMSHHISNHLIFHVFCVVLYFNHKMTRNMLCKSSIVTKPKPKVVQGRVRKFLEI